jgi:hypothetical protein
MYRGNLINNSEESSNREESNNSCFRKLFIFIRRYVIIFILLVLVDLSFYIYDKFPPYSEYLALGGIGFLPMILLLYLCIAENNHRSDERERREELIDVILGSNILTIEDDLQHIRCSICLKDIEIGDTYTSLRCDHMFHSDCIRTWFCIKTNCPLCRERA